MKIPKIDFKKIAATTVGEAGGLFALGELAKVKKVSEAKPGMKGVIYKVAAVAAQLLGGKTKGGVADVVAGASSALSVAGTSQLMSAFMPGKVAVIGGYEDYPISGPGIDMDEDNYPDDDDPNVRGYEENILQ